MPVAAANGIEIAYETFGNDQDPALLLVAGLGAQMVAFDIDFCDGLVDRGFFVIRFDNRDVGHSTQIETAEGLDLLAAITRAMQGEEVEPPYLLSDMADDAVGLMDALGIDEAHVAGTSLGGMIVQSIAIEHPHRLLSLTSIMSTTGDRDVGQPKPEALPVLITPVPSERESYVEHMVQVGRTIGSPEHFEEDRVRTRAGLSFDRGHHPEGVGRQLLAGAASGSRSEALRSVDLNALVIHGDADPLIDVSGGERTAEVLQGAELLILEGMGHDLPSFFWTSVIEGITNLAARSVQAP